MAPTPHHVLICEDDDATALLLERGIGQIPETTTSRFASVGQALLKIEGSRPSLVILDHMMPGVSGLDGLARLRKLDWGREVPILVYSAADIERDALAAGANAFLRKPASISALIAKVRELLEIV